MQLDQIPRTIPLESGVEHGGELLAFFTRCRKRHIGTDVELTIGNENKRLLVHSFILATYSDVFHELFFPDFYHKVNFENEKIC